MSELNPTVELNQTEESLDKLLYDMYSMAEVASTWAGLLAVDPELKQENTAIFMRGVGFESNAFARGITAAFKAVLNTLKRIGEKIAAFFKWLFKLATFSKEKGEKVAAAAKEKRGAPEADTVSVSDDDKGPVITTGKIIKDGKIANKLNQQELAKASAEEALEALDAFEKTIDADGDIQVITLPSINKPFLEVLRRDTKGQKTSKLPNGTKVEEFTIGQVTTVVHTASDGSQTMMVKSNDSAKPSAVQAETDNELHKLADEMLDITKANLETAKRSPDKVVNKFRIALERLHSKLSRQIADGKIDQKKADAITATLTKLSRDVVAAEAVDRTLRKEEQATVTSATKAVAALTKNLK